MVHGLGNSCMKFLLFTFNFIFVAIGATVMGLGGYFLYQSHYLGQAIEVSNNVAILAIVVGLVTFGVAFFGCCGASQESSCMLSTYALIVGVVFIAEIALAIVLLLYNDEVPKLVKAGIERTFERYNTTFIGVDETVDFLQSTFECCGVDGKQYWRERQAFQQSLPLSCCYKITDFQKYASCENPQQYATGTAWSIGCVQRIDSLLNQYLTALAGIMIVAGAIKIIAACFACSLANAVDY